jgi:hypothetical protein
VRGFNGDNDDYESNSDAGSNNTAASNGNAEGDGYAASDCNTSDNEQALIHCVTTSSV